MAIILCCGTASRTGRPRACTQSAQQNYRPFHLPCASSANADEPSDAAAGASTEDRGSADCNGATNEAPDASRMGTEDSSMQTAATGSAAEATKGGEEEEDAADVGTYGSFAQIVHFAAPALALYLINPTLSLIDTALVGQRSPTQLASLAPSGALLDYPGYILTILGIATQNLVATELGKGNEKSASDALSQGLSISLAVGIAMVVISAFFSESLLMLFCGERSIQLVPPALQYVSIRATAWPAVTVTSVLQSCLLARGNVISPMRSAAIGGIVNLIGDCMLIGHYGVGGAALATVAAQLTVLFLQASALDLPYKLQRVSLLQIKDFFALGGPLGIVNSLKIVFYAAVTLSASRIGVVETAAHQALVRVFILIVLFGEPLGQYAQTYMPRAFVRQDVRSALATTWNLVLTATVLGLSLGIGFMLVPRFAAHLFTSDSHVIMAMQPVGPALFAAGVFTPLTNVTDGCMIAQRRVWYLVASTACCTVLSCSLFCIPLIRESLYRIWFAASTYFVIRSGLHLLLLLGPQGWLRKNPAEHYLAAA